MVASDRPDSPDALALHLQEVRRGTVVLACLAACREPQYGYSLLETLAQAGIQVEANTLYPLLRRLDKQGLLTAEWNTDEPRPRKYYTLTDSGARVADDLRAEWLALTASLTDLWKDT
ncbi:PadR family transcriptional regulator [Brevibacterium yomogidense]|uniref:PadR family transcriptional regulator n=1 Tax=Brevibacterium yomogidense TaxID=946573 RepID=UPI0018E05D63|nr:PadR family transcriptional regulator [Brevibacterium yomogidense]